MKNLFTMALLLCSLTIIAQSKIRVLDKSTGEPVVNATIKVVGANKWTTTDIDGYFDLNVSPGAEIKITHLNYKPVTITNLVNQQLIYLEPNQFLMEEVIVRGNPLFDPTQSYVKSDYSEKVVQPKNAGELFSDINGFSIIKRGGYSVDPSFRASQYEQLNVQFDGGSKAMQACPSRMDPVSTLLNPEEVERIEIIKGPFTVRYGSTFGGVINMVTSNASATKEKLAGKVSSGYESNGNSMVNIVQLNSKLKNLDLSGNFSHRDYGNYKDGAGNEIPSSFRSLGYGLKAGYNFDENQRLQASFRQNFGRDILHAGLMMDTEKDNSSIAGLDYKLRVEKGNFAGINSKLYYSYVHHLMDNYNRPSAMMTRAFSDVEAATYGGKIETRWKFGKKWKLFTGLDVTNVARDGHRDRLVLKDMMGNQLEEPMKFTDKIWQESYVNDYGIFAETKYFAGPGSIFNLGVRLDEVVSDINDPDPVFLELYPELGHRTETNFSGTLSYKKILSPNYSLEFSFGRGVRSASMEERFLAFASTGKDSYEYVGNPDLKAEVNNQLEISFKGKTDLSGAFQKLDFGANVYYSRYENYIAGIIDEDLHRRFMPMQEPVHPKVFRNLDKAYKTGFETYAGLGFATYFSFSSSFSYVYTEDQDLGESLPLTPPFITRLKLAYDNEDFWASAEYNITSRQTNIAPSFGETESPGYELLDLKAGVNLFDHLKVGIGVLNLFDTYYYNHLNYMFNNQAEFENTPITEPGRNFTAFVNYSF